MNTQRTKPLMVPDPAALASVQLLCNSRDPYRTGPEQDTLFIRAMQEILLWHQQRSPFFAALLESKQIDPLKITRIRDLARIPMVHANFFKTHELLSVDRSTLCSSLTSSGTTGQKSQMFYDPFTLLSGQGMVAAIFSYYEWIKPNQPTNYLLYAYEPAAASRLGTSHTNTFLCKFAQEARVTFALRATGTGSHEFDLFGAIRTLQEYADEGLPVRIFGFPSFLYFTLVRMRDLGLSVTLPPDSLVFLGGGWKGAAGEQIPKLDLYALITDRLGIPDDRCREGYGSVEHSVPYVECSHHHLHQPVWSRVLIRDVTTLEPLDDGEPGFLHFITPHTTSVPAVSVLMGDLAVMHHDCPCGLETPYFEVLGRAGVSKNRSCAVAAAELLQREAL
ncbi:LuxE/PaaK family acyltransferase [Methanosphaerula palustris]|uniref:Acyl-protein synthetase LuxE n=1 Tax=Methanosphaerula palustris (strain ATCC BAA-1556 / DSM 19958 / E1-9c) TaxID=521011 RepID=B8GKT5_METPE|nr:acyl-protein synthase [Methanosphaerula palustris]ACL17231.1 acyl-protein synthetase LuxE [Methanosphaerula palustris E1-9c]